jgi:hypothetical protein
MSLIFLYGPDNKLAVKVTVDGISWQQNDIPDCWGPWNNLTKISSPGNMCNWPNTINVQPILPALSDPGFLSCVAHKGCPLGSLGQYFPLPYLGAGDTNRYTLLASKCRRVGGCRPGDLPSFSSNAIDQPIQMLSRWESVVHPLVAGTLDGPAWISLENGNLVLRLSHPEGGPFDPTPILTYNR